MKKKSPEFTKEWFAEQGRIGGKKTKALYGLKHYANINPKNKKNKPVDKVLDKPLV